MALGSSFTSWASNFKRRNTYCLLGFWWGLIGIMINIELVLDNHCQPFLPKKLRTRWMMPFICWQFLSEDVTAVCVCVCESLCYVRLFATPWTVAPQAPLSMGFSRQEFCSGLLLPSPCDCWVSCKCQPSVSLEYICCPVDCWFTHLSITDLATIWGELWWASFFVWTSENS